VGRRNRPLEIALELDEDGLHRAEVRLQALRDCRVDSPVDAACLLRRAAAPYRAITALLHGLLATTSWSHAAAAFAASW
jgi:hypothetical protein